MYFDIVARHEIIYVAGVFRVVFAEISVVYVYSVGSGGEEHKVSALVDVEHVAVGVVGLTRSYAVGEVVGRIFLFVIPKFASGFKSTYLDILAQLECEHLVAAFLGRVVHHLVGSDDVAVAGDASASYYFYVFDPFAEEHGVVEKCVSHILLGEVVFRILIGARVGG